MLIPVDLSTESVPCQPAESIRSVDRAFSILRVLGAARRPMRLSDISASTEMPKATVQRLLAVLERNGFIEKQHGRYEVGVAAVPLSYAFLIGNSLTQASLPVLQELAATTQETATLYVRHGHERIAVQRVEGSKPLRYSMPVVVGQRITLLSGAAGQVLAAAMSELDLSELLAKSEAFEFANGETMTRPQYLARLEQVRRQGYCVTFGERTPGVTSIAAPVVTAERGTIAALSLTGTSDRIGPDLAERLVVEVRHAAHAIAERHSHI